MAGAALNMEHELVRYDAMVTAIAECHRVDEVKDLANKAQALALYARQAQNVDAERKATAVRLRAERRAGELFKELERTSPQEKANIANAVMGHDVPATVAATSEYREALERTQTSERTAQRWQELATVPNDVFEKHLGEPLAIPTTSKIIADAKSVPTGPRMNDTSLWIWGRLRDFERMRCVDSDPNEIFDGMTDTMQADVRRILPTFVEWCEQLTTEVANA